MNAYHQMLTVGYYEVINMWFVSVAISWDDFKLKEQNPHYITDIKN